MTADGAGTADGTPPGSEGGAAAPGRYRLAVRLLEDLHSGTGSGSGTLDAVQLRDRQGNPRIARSHLKGLLVEEAHAARVLELLEEDAVTRLLGGRGPDARGAATMTSLYVTSDATRLGMRTATARRADDRGPKHDTLRSRETVPAGTCLEAEIRLRDTSLHEALALAVRRVSSLGARRNRGDGRVVTSLDLDGRSTHRPVDGAPRSPRPCLRLVLRARDPVCMAATGTPGNLVRTECFVRGQALQGAVVRWLLDNGQPASDLLQGPGAPWFGDARPVPVTGPLQAGARVQDWELIPIPLDHPTFKPPPQGASDWPWWAEPAGDADDDGQLERKPKRPGDREFLFRDGPGQAWQRYEPEISVHMRNNAGERRRRRDTEQKLFSQEEIAEDTLFLAEIDFPSEKEAKQFAARLEPVLVRGDWLTLGRGGAPVEVERAAWTARPAPAKLPGNAAGFRLVLASDLVARGPRLGFLSALDAPALVGLAVEDAGERARLLGDGLSVEARQDGVSLHGFNPVTGLPRIPALGIRRGSVFDVSGPPAALEALHGVLAARQFLGERPQEGFGRFCLDPVLEVAAAAASGLPAADAGVTRTERALAAGVALGRALAVRGAGGGPSATQWIALRKRVAVAGSDEEIDQVLEELAERASRPTQKAWQAVNLLKLSKRVDGEALDDRKLRLDAALHERITAARRNKREDTGA